VRHAEFPRTHRFLFELELEISSALSMSAGEMGVLIGDGLFALDDQELLFPGVSTPAAEVRLLSVALGAIGYKTWGRAAPISKAYRQLIDRAERTTKGNRNLGERLDYALGTIGAAQLNQRMLMAKLLGLRDKCRHPVSVTDADRTIAEALLAAAEAIAAAVEAATKPVM
jgi:hypothetical protein